MKIEEAIKRGLISKDRIEVEKSWLRCIDMDNDKDVERAATEIILSIVENQ